VVHLVWLDAVYEVAELPGSDQIAIVQKHPCAGCVRIYIDMVQSLGVKGAGPPDDAVDFIPLRQQQFGKIGTILPGNARDQSFLHVATLLEMFRSDLLRVPSMGLSYEPSVEIECMTHAYKRPGTVRKIR
jgi:hypothetical protein